MTMPSEMTPDQADLACGGGRTDWLNACIPSRQPPAHALRTGCDRASEWVMRHGCGAVGQQPVQEDHGFGAVADGVTIPGRIVFAEIRYSAATVNSNPGESCSIARSSRNCSRSFIAALSAGALFHPRYPARQTRVITGQEYPTKFLQDYRNPSKAQTRVPASRPGGTGQGIYGREPTPELRL